MSTILFFLVDYLVILVKLLITHVRVYHESHLLHTKNHKWFVKPTTQIVQKTLTLNISTASVLRR